MRTNTYTSEPAYGLLVESCKTHGISRTVAFELAASGLLETFKIGARRYVKFASLHSLPERLADRQPGFEAGQ